MSTSTTILFQITDRGNVEPIQHIHRTILLKRLHRDLRTIETPVPDRRPS